MVLFLKIRKQVSIPNQPLGGEYSTKGEEHAIPKEETKGEHHMILEEEREGEHHTIL